MFDIGIQELIVIFIIVLVVFGPEKLPEIARIFGKGVADLQRALRSAKEEIDTEVTKVKDDVKNELKDPIALKNELFNADNLFPVADSAPPRQDDMEGKTHDTDTKSDYVSAEGSQDMHENQAPLSQIADRQRVLQQINKSMRGDLHG